MATRHKGSRHTHSLPIAMSRHTLRPNNQIFRTKTHGRRSQHSTGRSASHATIRSSNPILSPPSIRSISFGRAAKAEAVTFTPSRVEEPVITNNFPSPVSHPQSAAMAPTSFIGRSLRPSPSIKRLLLAAVPGFFGVMGLGQIFEKRRSRGLLFLLAGALISFFSSWYTILPERIASFVTGGAALPPYALSWMSYFTGYSAVAGEASMILLALVPAVWALQLYDSISPIVVVTPHSGMSAVLKVPSTKIARAASKSRQEMDQNVREFANNLGSAKSLVSYLWER